MPRPSGFPRLRATYRAVALAGATLVSYLLFWLGSAALLPSRRRREGWRDGVRRRWARWVTRILGLRVTVRGTPPPQPFLLVANHLSYLDIPVLLAAAGGVFVAKAELGSWPVIGHLCRVSDTVLIDRGSKRDLLRVARLIEERLAAGCGVSIFPEGTTGRGDGLLPFKASLLEVAVRTGSPVHNATLFYRSPPGAPPADESICWWRDMEFLPHLRQLLTLPWVDATVDFAAEPVAGEDRKELAAELRASMAARFVPTVEPEPAHGAS